MPAISSCKMTALVCTTPVRLIGNMKNTTFLSRGLRQAQYRVSGRIAQCQLFTPPAWSFLWLCGHWSEKLPFLGFLNCWDRLLLAATPGGWGHRGRLDSTAEEAHTGSRRSGLKPWEDWQNNTETLERENDINMKHLQKWSLLQSLQFCVGVSKPKSTNSVTVQVSLKVCVCLVCVGRTLTHFGQ